MSNPLPWISPSDADDMLYDDPMGSLPDFGFALLRKTAKGKENRVADLARAKLQPSKPADTDWLADGLWPITCASHRIVTAPGVAVEPGALEEIFQGYDAKVKAHQKLLAVVLTMRFPHSWQPADILSLVGKYTLEKFALQRRLTSMTVVHMPSHVVCMARVHRSSGWGEVHPDLIAKTAQMQFQQEWEQFYDIWVPRYRDG